MDPGEMITNTVIGGFTGALGFGVKRITQSAFIDGKFPTTSDKQFLLRESGNSVFAEYNPETGQILRRVDLQGPSHSNIQTPHSHQAFWNTIGTGENILNGWRNIQSFSSFKAYFINLFIQSRK